MASSDDDMPPLSNDSDVSEEDEPPRKKAAQPVQHSKPSASRNTPEDDDDDLPGLIDDPTDDDEDEDDDNEEPPPLCGGDDSESDDEPAKTSSRGPTLPGLRAGFFAKPKSAAPPPTATTPKPTPAEPAKAQFVPKSVPAPGPVPTPTPAPAPAAAPPQAAKPATAAKPAPATKPAPKAKGAPGQKDGEVEDGSEGEGGNSDDEVPDLLDADDEDEDSAPDDQDAESDVEQESEEDDESSRPSYFARRTGPKAGKTFYPDYEQEDRALEERRKREAERKRREEERAKERAERKRKELEEKRRRQAEARKRAIEDAQVYANSPEARELAEQARLRAEAEFEEKRLQMGLGPRDQAVNEGEEEIGPGYFCRGTHCPGGQKALTKSMEYIEFWCTERCLLVYHTGDCHRKDVKLKMEREHGVWREEEGAKCMTPDCPGTLTKGTKWNRFGKVSYQIIGPEKYEKKRREKERQKVEEKAAKQAAKLAASQKRQKKHDVVEDEAELNAKFRRQAKSRTFTNFSFQGATGAVAETPQAEPIAEEPQPEAKEQKPEQEEAPRRRGRKKHAEGGAAHAAEAHGGEVAAEANGGGQEEGTSGGGAPGIAVLVKAPMRHESFGAADREAEDLPVKEYRKKEDEESVFTLGNKDRAKEKGKQKVDAVPEPVPAKGKGKKKGMTLNINDFITSDDPEPAPRPFFPPNPMRPFVDGPNWRGPAPNMHPHGPPPRAVYRQPQEEFPELHRGPGGAPPAAPMPGFQERPRDPFVLALDSIRVRDTNPTRHLLLEDVDSCAENEDLRSLLWSYGMVEDMTRFKGRDMAFVTLSSVEEATAARSTLHNKALRGRKIRLDFVSIHPSPAFFANYQPQWAAHDHVTPRVNRPSPSAPAFIPGGGRGPAHEDFSGGEQWEEFDWRESGEDGSGAASSDWGSEAPVGSFGSSEGGSGLRTALSKGKMKPDAPEFVPKAVLLAQNKASPSPPSTAKSASESKAVAAGGSDSGAAKPSGSGGGLEGSAKTGTRPELGGGGTSGQDSEPPVSASQAEKEQPGVTKPGEADQGRAAAASTATGWGAASVAVSVKPATPEAETGTAELLNRGASSKLESARDASGSVGAKLESAKGLLGSGGSAHGSVGSGLGRTESARELLVSGGSNRSQSVSPVVPLSPALQAVQAGRPPMLLRQPAYAMGQVVATTTETLTLYHDSIKLDRGYCVPGVSIAPHACALFLFNIDRLELHGFYESTSASYVQMQDPYSLLMYAAEQPHIAFRRVRKCPVPLGRTELEPVLPPGWWSASTWHLPLLLPPAQTEMLLMLFAEKADYEERKKRGFADELEGQLEMAQAAAGASTPPVTPGIPLPTPAKVALAEIAAKEDAPSGSSLASTAAVPATIAAAAKGGMDGTRIGEANGNANGTNGVKPETNGDSLAQSGSQQGTQSNEDSGRPILAAGGTGQRPVSAGSGINKAAKPEANGRLHTPPKTPSRKTTSYGSGKPGDPPASPSTPLPPQPNSPPLSETTTPGTGDISDILAEIKKAATGWGESLPYDAAGAAPPQSASTTPRTPPPPSPQLVSTPPGREGAPPRSDSGASDTGSSSLPADTESAEVAPNNMQSILNMLLPKPASAPAPAAPPVVPSSQPPAAARPYRPPVKYNPLGQAPPSNGRVHTPPAREATPPVREAINERTACKLCWARKADFFLKECGHMGPCLSCHEDPRVDSSHCPQCNRVVATRDPAKFIRMFR